MKIGLVVSEEKILIEIALSVDVVVRRRGSAYFVEYLRMY